MKFNVLDPSAPCVRDERNAPLRRKVIVAFAVIALSAAFAGVWYSRLSGNHAIVAASVDRRTTGDLPSLAPEEGTDSHPTPQQAQDEGGLRDRSAEDSVTSGEAESSVPQFATYAPLQTASSYAANAWTNSKHVQLDQGQLARLQDVIDERDAALKALQARFREHVEAWGKILIENGTFDFPAPGIPEHMESNAIRVGMVRNGVHMATTVRPGQNAELDLLATELSAYHADSERLIRSYFDDSLASTFLHH